MSPQPCGNVVCTHIELGSHGRSPTPRRGKLLFPLVVSHLHLSALHPGVRRALRHPEVNAAQANAHTQRVLIARPPGSVVAYL